MGKDDSFDPSTILRLPDYDRLLTEVEKRRAELAMLVMEQDDLLFQECKNIEMAYMITIGGLEYKVYELECAIRRRKRQAELIQAKKNRQEPVFLGQFEELLDSEFREYQTRLDEQVAKMNEALSRSRGKLLTDQETVEMKKLYRLIVKSLHPDLNPDLSAALAQLFCNAVEAYKNCDLEGLRVISAMVAAPALPAAPADGLAALAQESARLKLLIKSVQDRIAKTKSEYPYTMKELLQSPEKSAARQSELALQIRQLKVTLDLCMAKIAALLRSKDG